MHRSDDFDLLQWHAEAKMEAVQGILDIVEKLSLADGPYVIDLLRSRRILQQFVKVRKLPVRMLINELRIGRRGVAPKAPRTAMPVPTNDLRFKFISIIPLLSSAGLLV